MKHFLHFVFCSTMMMACDRFLIVQRPVNGQSTYTSGSDSCSISITAREIQGMNDLHLTTHILKGTTLQLDALRAIGASDNSELHISKRDWNFGERLYKPKIFTATRDTTIDVCLHFVENLAVTGVIVIPGSFAVCNGQAVLQEPLRVPLPEKRQP